MNQIVALHGAGGSPSDFEEFADHLSPSFELVPLVLREPWRWEQVLERLETDLRRFGLEHAPVIGTSLGGMVAALWARRARQCPAVVNLDGHGVPTQAIRYPAAERAALQVRLTALREQFAQFGHADLQEAMESVDWLHVLAPGAGRRLRGRVHRGGRTWSGQDKRR